MPRNNDVLAKRNDAMYKRYNELRAQNYKGKQLYTYEAILAMLSDEFWLQTASISRLLLTMSADYKPAT